MQIILSRFNGHIYGIKNIFQKEIRFVFEAIRKFLFPEGRIGEEINFRWKE